MTVNDILESVELALVGTPEAIDENSPTGTQVPGLTLRTTVDGVSRIPASGITYQLANVDIANLPFSVEPPTANEAFIQVNGVIDFETNQEFVISVGAQVIEAGVTVHTTESTTITINNVLEIVRLRPSTSFSFDIPEHSTGSLELYNPLSLIEDERGEPLPSDSAISWTLTNDASSRFNFVIGSTTGSIFGTGSNNYEPFGLNEPITPGYDPNEIPTVTITAQAVIGDVTSSPIPITVSIQNRVEALTITNVGIQPIGYAFETAVNIITTNERDSITALSGTILTLAIDDERGVSIANADLAFELTGPSVDSSIFNVNSDGRFGATDQLDYEVSPEVTFEVKVTYDGTDTVGGAPIEYTSPELTVSVINVNEMFLVSDLENASSPGMTSTSWTENVNGVLDGINLAVTDDTNSLISDKGLTIATNSANSASQNHFSIAANTGVLSVVQPFDYSVATQHEIVVHASALNGIGERITSEGFTITVNVLSVPSRVDTFSVSEGSLDFWAVIDFGGEIEVDTAQLANISIGSVSGGILTDVTITDRRGSTATSPAEIPANYRSNRSIYLRIAPQGDNNIDGGEALGNEAIVINLPGDSTLLMTDSSLLTNRATGVVVPSSVTANPPNNHAPEIVGLNFITNTVKSVVFTEDGGLITTLDYELELTRVITQAEAESLLPYFAIEATTSAKGDLEASFTAGRVDLPEGRLVNDPPVSEFVTSVLTRGGRHYAQITEQFELSPAQVPMYKSYYAVYTPPANPADSIIEDCASPTWYEARQDLREDRNTPCYSEVVVPNLLESFTLFGRNDAVELVFNEDVTLSASALEPNSNALGYLQGGVVVDRTTAVLDADKRTLLISATETNRFTDAPAFIDIGNDIENSEGPYDLSFSLGLPTAPNHQPILSTTLTFVKAILTDRFTMTISTPGGTATVSEDLISGSTRDIIDRIILTDTIDNTPDITIDGDDIEYVRPPIDGGTVLEYLYEFPEDSGYPTIIRDGAYIATFIFGEVLLGLSGSDGSIIRSRHTQATNIETADNVSPTVAFDFDFTIADDQTSIESNEIRYDLTLEVTYSEAVLNDKVFLNTPDSVNYKVRQISASGTRVSTLDITDANLSFRRDGDSQIIGATITRQVVWNPSIIGYRAYVQSDNGSSRVSDLSGRLLIGATNNDPDATESTGGKEYVYSELTSVVRTHQVAIDGTTDFWLVIEFDGPVTQASFTSANGLANIRITSVSEGSDHLVTSAEITQRILGSSNPPITSDDFVAANSIFLKIRVEGSAPDNGEAAGVEQVSLEIPDNLFTATSIAGGLNTPPPSLVVELRNTSKPEIVGFDLSSLEFFNNPGLTDEQRSAFNPELIDFGPTASETGKTIFQILTKITLSRPISNEQAQELVQATKLVANERLDTRFVQLIANGAERSAVESSAVVPEMGELPILTTNEAIYITGKRIYVRQTLSVTPEQLARTKSVHAVYEPTAGTAEFIEDCQGDDWYSATDSNPRYETRTTNCYAQEIHINPIASYSLFDDNIAVEMTVHNELIINDIGFVDVSYVNRSSNVGPASFRELLPNKRTFIISVAPNQDASDRRSRFSLASLLSAEIVTESIADSTVINRLQLLYPPSIAGTELVGSLTLPQSEPRVLSVEFTEGHPQNKVEITFGPINTSITSDVQYDFTLLSRNTNNIIEKVIFRNRDNTINTMIDGEDLILESRFTPTALFSPTSGTSTTPSVVYIFPEDSFPESINEGDVTATFVFDDLSASRNTNLDNPRPIRSRQVQATNVDIPDNVDPQAVFDIKLSPSDNQDGLLGNQVRYELIADITYSESTTDDSVDNIDFYRLVNVSFDKTTTEQTVTTLTRSTPTLVSTVITLTSTVTWNPSIAGYRIAIQTIDGIDLTEPGVRDNVGNPVSGAVNTDPQTGEMTAQPFAYSRVQPVVNVTPIALGDDTNNFWVVVDFGTKLETSTTSTDEALGQIRLDLDVPDTITSATIVGTAVLGLPEGMPTINGLAVISTNALHFEVRPTGTLDGGESATGADQFSVRLPAGLGMIGSNPVPTVPLVFNALSNGAPEVTSFMLENQVKTITPSGEIGEITYHMSFTEAVTIESTIELGKGLTVYRSTADQNTLDRALASGASMNDIAGVSALTMTEVFMSINQPDMRTIAITLSMLAETASATSETQSYVLSFNPTVISANRAITSVADTGETVEDCQSLVWYSGSVRKETRTSECIAQDSAVAQPSLLVSFPEVISSDDLIADPTNTLAPNVSTVTNVARVAREVLLNSSVAEVIEHLGIRGLDNISEINSSRELATLKEEVTIDMTWSFKTNRGFRLLTESGDTYAVDRQISIVAGYGFTERTIFVYDNRTVAAVTIENNTRFGDFISRNITLVRELTTSSEVQTITRVVERETTDLALRVAPAGETVWRIANAWTRGMPLGRLATDDNVYTLGNGFSSIRVIGVEASRAESQPLQVARIVSTQGAGAESFPYIVEDNPVDWLIYLNNHISDGIGSNSSCGYIIEDDMNTCSNYSIAPNSIPSSGAQTYISSDVIALNNARGRIELAISRFSTATDPTIIGGLPFVNFELTIDYQATSNSEPRSLTINVDVPLFDTPPDVSLFTPYACLKGNAVSTVEIDGEESISVQALDDVCLQRSYQTLAYEYDVRSNGGTPTTTDALLILPESDKADSLFGDLPELPNNDEPVAYVNFQMNEVRPGYDGSAPTQNGTGSVLIDLPDLEEGERWAFYKLIDGEWRTFDASHLGMTKSTAGLQCPSDSGDSESPYRDGAGNPNGGSAGSNCALVEIVDGEENDANRRTSGIIVDPLAIARATGGGSRRGGGGAMSVTELLGLLGLIITASLIQVHRRRRVLAVAEATRRQN